MRRKTIVSASMVIAATAMVVALMDRPAAADPPSKKRVTGDREPPRRVRGDDDRAKQPHRKDRDRTEDGHGDKQPPRKGLAGPKDVARAHRIEPRRSYIPTRRDYGHVRMTRHHRGSSGHLHIRPIVVRSAHVSPVVLHRFEDGRQEQIRRMIQLLRENHRRQAVEIWTTFVDGLANYHEPIDLDEVMLYIAREGCIYGNDRLLFHAAKLEHLRETADRLDEYAYVLQDQADACHRGVRGCSPDTVRDIESEIVRVRAERQVLDIEAGTLDNRFETVIASSTEYEQSFAAVYEDMYREVEVRVSFSP